MYSHRTTQLNLLLTIGIAVRRLMRAFITKKQKTDLENSTKSTIRYLTSQVHVRSNDIALETRRDARSKPAPVSTPTAYIARTYDTIDTSKLAIHQPKNDYHPKEHDNATVETFLECRRASTNRNRTQSDE